MIAHLRISNLIDEREKQLRGIERFLSDAETLSESMLRYASKKPASKASIDSSLVYDVEEVQQTFDGNLAVYSRLRGIHKELSIVDGSASSIQKLSSSAPDLQQLSKESASKIVSLKEKYKEHEKKYLSTGDQQQKISEGLAQLRDERDKISKTVVVNGKKAVIRKTQIKKARWFLLVPIFGAIAYRFLVAGGIS